VADLAKYNTELQKLQDSMGYTITYAPPGDSFTIFQALRSFNWSSAVLLDFITAIAIAGGIWFIYWSKRSLPLPPPLQVLPLEGIGGWLSLVTIQHLTRPIAFAINLINSGGPILNITTWRSLTDPDGTAYHPYWASTLYFETLANMLGLVFSGVLIVLFFKKRAVWRYCYIALVAFVIIVGVIDIWLMQQIPVTKSAVGGSMRGLAGTIGASLIWVPYCLVSRRVKATFRY
jgi:hypothetical protein